MDDYLGIVEYLMGEEVKSYATMEKVVELSWK